MTTFFGIIALFFFIITLFAGHQSQQVGNATTERRNSLAQLCYWTGTGFVASLILTIFSWIFS